jgi:D-alanyl-D-alanine dipeptidase
MNIRIVECGEKLVEIKTICPAIHIRYNGKAYLRKTVAEMLAKAQENLPNGYKFVIRSAWRSPKEQKVSEKRVRNRIEKQHPNWTSNRVHRELRKFVAPTKGLHASGHLAGAAIDLDLKKNEITVPLRCHKISFQENAKPFHHKLPNHIKINRQIMHDALNKSGLSNYPHEYWHWSYGDIEWAKVNKKDIAIYEDNQETHYFDTEQDLRIQKNDRFAKIWLKGGQIHDEQREEIEIKFNKNDFAAIEKIMNKIGHKVKIKWFRKRREYDWNGITVCLDYTKGYGYVIELEKLCSDKEQDKALLELKCKLAELDIPLTPKEEFNDKFKDYEKNWQKLIKDQDD